MAKILVFLQHENGQLIKSTASVISAAAEYKEIVSAEAVYGVLLGEGAEKAAKAVPATGIERLFVSEDPALSPYTNEAFASFVVKAAELAGADTIFISHSSTGKDFAPVVAARLDYGMASDVIGLNKDGSFLRPMYAGNAIAEVELTTAGKVISTRVTAFQVPDLTQDGNLQVEKFTAEINVSRRSEVVEFKSSGGLRPDLGDAEIVVSGGRGVQSKEGFEKYIYPLADKLKAAVGASRAAVDSGFAPNDWQVGQTGRAVAPKLYIAIGLSGAIQHIAGMKDSKVIVAINKDPDAPIFEVADYGLVGDLTIIIPELLSAL